MEQEHSFSWNMYGHDQEVKKEKSMGKMRPKVTS
jgi:hypothetical protein